MSEARAAATSHEGRLEALGWELPPARDPGDPLLAVVVHQGIARTSGQLPRDEGGLRHPGRVGDTVNTDDGVAAARLCALNALAALRAELGSLDAIERVIAITGYVACAPTFNDQPTVIDGASAVLRAVFGEAGRHARSAIGVAALPRGAAVEVEVTVALRPGGHRPPSAASPG